MSDADTITQEYHDHIVAQLQERIAELEAENAKQGKEHLFKIINEQATHNVALQAEVRELREYADPCKAIITALLGLPLGLPPASCSVEGNTDG